MPACHSRRRDFSFFTYFKFNFSVKNISLASLALALISMSFFLACNNDANPKTETTAAAGHDHANGEHVHLYVCPMHPEVVEKQAGTCPKCNMQLEERHPEERATEYEMSFSNPTPAAAGSETTLLFKPKIKDSQVAVVPLDVQHEKKIHLIVASDDLAYFDHIHPEIQADGSFAVKTTFPSGGKYWLFADYKPTGADAQLEKIALEVSGKSPAAKTWANAKTSTTTAGGYSVSLASEIEKFVDKGETHIIVKVLKNGKEIMASALENYLGAKGHAVVISADGEKRYLHIHPGIESDRLHLAASFEKAGVYRGWLQFQHAGKLQTADFVINVVEGMGETPEHSHDHGDGHSHSH
jgi:hypothetical protein